MKIQTGVILILAILLAPALAMAQDAPKPITWVNYMQAKPGQDEALVELFKKRNGQMFDRLMADGILSSWGIAEPMTHRGQKWTHLVWATVQDWAHMDKLVNAMGEEAKSRSEKENQEIEAAFKAASDFSGHRDVINRHVVFSAAASGGPAPGYLVLGFYKAAPGEADEITNVYETVAAPVYDKLQKDGAVAAYGFAAQELDLDPDWTHVSWFFLNDLSGMDARAKAFAASWEARSDAEEEMLEAWFEKVLEPEHHDLLFRVVHWAAK